MYYTQSGSELMKKCTGLQYLSLSCNHIGDQGAMALAGALATSHNLIELDLQCNAIGDEGAVAIAKAAKECTKELQLRLWNFKITTEGVKRVLSINRMLKYRKKSQNVLGML